MRIHLASICVRRIRSVYLKISVSTLYPDTCGRLYPYIFVYADITVSEPVFFRTRFSKMAAIRNVVCSMPLGLLSSLIACLELNVPMLNLNFNYLRRRLSIMRLLAISDSGIEICPGLHANAKIAILAKNRRTPKKCCYFYDVNDFCENCEKSQKLLKAKDDKSTKSVAIFAILTIFAKNRKICRTPKS